MKKYEYTHGHQVDSTVLQFESLNIESIYLDLGMYICIILIRPRTRLRRRNMKERVRLTAFEVNLMACI